MTQPTIEEKLKKIESALRKTTRYGTEMDDIILSIDGVEFQVCDDYDPDVIHHLHHLILHLINQLNDVVPR